jgi:hypothetical protein
MRPQCSQNFSHHGVTTTQTWQAGTKRSAVTTCHKPDKFLRQFQNTRKKIEQLILTTFFLIDKDFLNITLFILNGVLLSYVCNITKVLTSFEH